MVTSSNFPLLWMSKLQTYIVISIVHLEYVVFSHSVRALLPLRSIIKEYIDNWVIDSKNLKFVSSFTIYKENIGAIVVENRSMITTT